MGDSQEPDIDELEEDVSPRSMKVAATLQRKGGDEFAKPGKLVEVRFAKGHSLSLTASRLLALMILAAGGDAWRDMRHRLRKSEIRRGHKGNERIVDMLEELHRTLFAVDDLSWRGKKATKRFSLIQASWEESEEAENKGWLEWEFTADARKLIQESQTYAVMNRQAVLGFRSAYSLKLYEEGALRLNRRQPIWKVDVIGLRAALGIDPEKYGDFAQIRRKVLQVAKAEIDQLAHYTVEWREVRQGRAVKELEFRFTPKDAPAQIETVDELARHSSGRAARRENTVEEVAVSGDALIAPDAINKLVANVSAKLAAPERVPRPKFASFPSGSLKYGSGEFYEIGKDYGGGWDVDMIATAYRESMGDRLDRISGRALEKSWKGWCESYFSRRGRPA